MIGSAGLFEYECNAWAARITSKTPRKLKPAGTPAVGFLANYGCFLAVSLVPAVFNRLDFLQQVVCIKIGNFSPEVRNPPKILDFE
jgi:hypothetical protein